MRFIKKLNFDFFQYENTKKNSIFQTFFKLAAIKKTKLDKILYKKRKIILALHNSNIVFKAPFIGLF